MGWYFCYSFGNPAVISNFIPHFGHCGLSNFFPKSFPSNKPAIPPPTKPIPIPIGPRSTPAFVPNAAPAKSPPKPTFAPKVAPAAAPTSPSAFFPLSSMKCTKPYLQVGFGHTSQIFSFSSAILLLFSC